MNHFSRALGVVSGLILILSTFGPAPSHIRGIIQTETGNQDRRLDTWRDMIMYLDPDRRMFTQLLLRLDKKSVDGPEFHLFQRQHRSKWVRMSEALTNSEIDVSVVDGSAFSVNDVIMFTETEENALVTAVSGNTLTVTRGILGTTATATVATDGWIRILYSRRPEFGSSGTPLTTDYDTISGYVQLFSATYGQSGTNKATKKRGPNDLSEERKLALEDYKRQMEEAFFWGHKSLTVEDGEVFRTTQGLDAHITTNRKDAEGGLGFGDIGWLVNTSTRFGGTKKIWFCGRDARMELDTLGLSYMRIKPEDNVLGMAVDGVRSSFGEFMMVTHHGLENAHADRIYVVDPAHIACAVLRGMKHSKNLLLDVDGEKYEFLGESGLWLDTEEAHMVVTGVSDTI